VPSRALLLGADVLAVGSVKVFSPTISWKAGNFIRGGEQFHLVGRRY
jgi:hypothetical protein